MKKPTHADVADGTAWIEFCENLKKAGQIITQPRTPASAFDRAEGFRYLSRLLRVSLENNIEFSNPCFPQFFSLSHETVKIANDNPDNIYLNCNISGQYDYRITGYRGTVDYLSIGVKAGSYDTTNSMRSVGQILGSELQINSEGYFELILSCKKHPGNWLPITPDTTSIIVRETFLDRSKETPARLKIECLNPVGNNYLDPTAFAQQLQSASQFVYHTANMFVGWMDIFAEHINELYPNDQAMTVGAGGDPNIDYTNGYWRLAPDEALVIEFSDIPECKTWNFQVSNYWMESLDYRYYKIHTNKHLATYEADGSIRIVVAHQDPGAKYPNWLTTAGHSEGGMLFRWTEAKSHPPLHTRVVKLSQL